MKFTGVLRDVVKFARSGNAGIVTLNRPKAMNALNHQMVKLITPQLKTWKEDKTALVIIKGKYSG